MKLVSAPDIVDWLKNEWDQTLEWDHGNIEKLKKHGFTVIEVNKMFSENFLFLGEVLGDWGERRFIIYSHIDDRFATIAWTSRNTKIRVISCRRSRTNEKKEYKKFKQII